MFEVMVRWQEEERYEELIDVVETMYRQPIYHPGRFEFLFDVRCDLLDPKFRGPLLRLFSTPIKSTYRSASQESKKEYLDLAGNIAGHARYKAEALRLLYELFVALKSIKDEDSASNVRQEIDRLKQLETGPYKADFLKKINEPNQAAHTTPASAPR